MTDADIAEVVKSSLYSVAPDLEGEALRAEEAFRDQFEFDSMDHLNFIIALHKQTGIAIAERDYGLLQSLSSAVAYLKSKGFGQ